MESAGSLWYKLLALRNKLQILSNGILGFSKSFGELTLRLPRESPGELAFIQSVTWLYGFYFEAGQINFKFLLERMETFNFPDLSKHQNHYLDIRKLRTFLQHTLDLDSNTNLDLQEYCGKWFFTRCGSTLPADDLDWEMCLDDLLRTSILFLEGNELCIRRIEQDESSASIVRQWTARLNQYHPRHEFEKLVGEVAYQIGQNWLDPLSTTNRYYEKWTKELKNLTPEYDFLAEARKLIEATILSEHDLPLPISGTDVIEEFGIAPGAEVRKFLLKARQLYFSNPTDRQTLLANLKKLAEKSPEEFG